MQDGVHFLGLFFDSSGVGEAAEIQEVFPEVGLVIQGLGIQRVAFSTQALWFCSHPMLEGNGNTIGDSMFD